MSKKTWLVTYLNSAAETVQGDRMTAVGDTYNFWDDKVSPNGPFLVISAKQISSIREQQPAIEAQDYGRELWKNEPEAPKGL